MNATSPLRMMTRKESSAHSAFRSDVLAGLARKQKEIPARWFYDARGSQLFEQITALPEYYLTRSEIGLLEAHGREIGSLVGSGRVVVEFGSGNSRKTPLLLSRVAPQAYVPIDISGETLRQSCVALAARFPGLAIVPFEADFTEAVAVRDSFPDSEMLGFFPGSTIGNLTPSSAVDLLRSMRDTLGPSAQLLIGFDTVKGLDALLPAYDDAQGVTAQFNLNLLHRINRELAATIPAERFRHQVRWNTEWSRIEMHLEAQDNLSFEIAGKRFSLAAGETIHTENSHKYTRGRARLLLQAGDWTPVREWTDERESFLIVLAEATES